MQLVHFAVTAAMKLVLVKLVQQQQFLTAAALLHGITGGVL